ncbi:MAG: hypothetical protein LBS39_03645 [Campylobacteraceae bacterium]|jgi:hypothetical protein|nr:hypothetical protein [Campylobacteraceae bacterium]
MAILFKGKKSDGGKTEMEIFKKLIIYKKASKGDIKALHVEADSTHKKSCITAEQIYVNEHYGEIIGGDVEIKYIKGGKVVANTVKVGYLKDAEITANYVNIDNLGSNNKIISTNTIEINNIQGVKNTLVIKPPIDENTLEELSSLYDRVALFKAEFDKTNTQLERKLKEVEKQREKAQKYKLEIEKTRQNGDIPHVDLLISIKEFNMNIREYDTLIKTIKGLERYIQEDEEEFSKLQNNIILNGKIIINSSCKENNDILFVLPKYDLGYKLVKNDNISEIYLKYSGNKEFQLEIKEREIQQ